MDTPSHNLEELVERYLQDKMSLAEREEFEKKIQSDPSLKQIVQEEKASQLLLDAYENRSLKNLVDGLSEEKLASEQIESIEQDQEDTSQPIIQKRELAIKQQEVKIKSANLNVDSGAAGIYERKLKEVWNAHPPKPKERASYKISEEVLYELMGNIFCPGPFYFLVFDFYSYEFTYVNRKISEVIGYEPEQMTLRFLTKILLEADLDHLLNCEKMAGSFYYSFLPKELISRYKLSYGFRIKDSQNQIKQILHQSFPLSSDEQDYIASTLIVHSDITHHALPPSKTISFMSLDEGTHYLGLDPNTESFSTKVLRSPLSQRETEVLQLLAEGDNVQDISLKLSLSIHTIHTHRNNIRKKLETRNTTQAAVIAAKNGWI